MKTISNHVFTDLEAAIIERFLTMVIETYQKEKGISNQFEARESLENLVIFKSGESAFSFEFKGYPLIDDLIVKTIKRLAQPSTIDANGLMKMMGWHGF